MKLIYVANVRMPTEKAHGLETAKLCEVFARQGIEVELVCPFRFNPVKRDPFGYYQISRTFKIKKIPSIDLMPIFPGTLGFLIQYFSFAISATIYLIISGLIFKKDLIFFSHDHLCLFLISFLNKNIYYDLHDFPSRFLIFYRSFFNRTSGIISTNKWKKRELLEKFFIPPKKISYIPNATDTSKFDIDLTKIDCRQKLNLPLDRKLVVYTGHLYSWKGVQTLAEASRFLPKKTEVFFVGGTDKDIKEFKIENARFKIQVVGHKPHSEIPYWLKAADVLVLPNTAKEDISKYWTSPLKMFEYMASKTPIVASDLPSIRDILNEENAVFCEPDNPKSLALAIEKILKDKVLAKKVAYQAYQDVQKYTWDNRAKEILNLIVQNSSF